MEGRFPFLDYIIIEFAGTVPPEYKLHVLNEKYLLKRTYRDMLPEHIVNRPKQPYRAPIGRCFISSGNGTSDMLSREMIEEFGYFNYRGVEALLKKFSFRGGRKAGERDEMALVGIVSLQLLHQHFIRRGGF